MESHDVTEKLDLLADKTELLDLRDQVTVEVLLWFARVMYESPPVGK